MRHITLTGAYKGKDTKGIIIGGQRFKPNNVTTADVEEMVFLKLQAAKENGWFQIHSHNYEEYLKANGRKVPVPAIEEVEGKDEGLMAPDKEVDDAAKNSVDENNADKGDGTAENTFTEESAPAIAEGTKEVTPAIEEGTKEAVVLITEYSIDEFVTFDWRKQNSLIEKGEVTGEIIKHIVDNAGNADFDYKNSTIKLAREAMEKIEQAGE